MRKMNEREKEWELIKDECFLRHNTTEEIFVKIRNGTVDRRMLGRILGDRFEEVIEFAMEDIIERMDYLNILEANLSYPGGWQLLEEAMPIPFSDEFKLSQDFAMKYFDLDRKSVV